MELFTGIPQEIMEHERLEEQPAHRYMRMDTRTPGLYWNLSEIEYHSVGAVVPIQLVYGWRRGTQKLPWLPHEKE